MLVRICVALTLLIFSTAYSIAQDIENVDFKVDGERIIVTYTLVYCNANRKYDVALYVWQDGQSRQALRIDGDVYGQTCGSGKTIYWDVLADNEELVGKVKMEVRITAEHIIEQVKTRRKKDHGYIGIMVGGSTPFKHYMDEFTFPYPSDDLQSPGASFELTASWLGRRQGIMGYTTSVRYATSITRELMNTETSWANASFLFGPLFSIPLSRRVVWDLRPMLGYSHSFATGRSYYSIYYNPDNEPVDSGNICVQLGTVFRFNMRKWLNLLVAADYFQTQPRFFETNINMNYITFSMGCGVRF